MPRHLAIGDIHGCAGALQHLCQFVGIRQDDVIITLGDYCNRGPNTREVLDWLLWTDSAHQLRALRGNHEIMMLRARDNDEEYQRWLKAGGNATLRSYGPRNAPGSLSDIPDEHWDFLENRLLAYFETSSHFFVHANAYAELPLDEQPEFMLYWEPFHEPPRHESGKIMICGHTSQRSGLPKVAKHGICIDSGACITGWLTCLHAETGKIWQANADGERREMWVDDLIA